MRVAMLGTEYFRLISNSDVQMWPAFREAYVWDVLRRYFCLRNISPTVPFGDISRPHLAVYFPHAVFPMAFMLTSPIYGLPGTGETLHAACMWLAPLCRLLVRNIKLLPGASEQGRSF